MSTSQLGAVLAVAILWLGTLAGFVFGIWLLREQYRTMKLSDEEYQKAHEGRGKALLGDFFTIGQVPKEFRRLLTTLGFIIAAAWTVGCAIALYLITSLVLK